jgi:uncharacterized protein (DUF952 family)
LEQARHQLTPEGLILLEIESTQGSTVKALAEAHYPASKVHILKDLSGQDRCVEIKLTDLIIHLCPRIEWLQAQQKGYYQDNSLQQDGFIHCSQPGQILEVANRFYQGIPDLVLLWIVPDRSASKIHWEPADGTQFPHIYGPINLDAVISVTDFNPDSDGIYRVFRFPD